MGRTRRTMPVKTALYVKGRYRGTNLLPTYVKDKLRREKEGDEGGAGAPYVHDWGGGECGDSYVSSCLLRSGYQIRRSYDSVRCLNIGANSPEMVG